MKRWVAVPALLLVAVSVLPHDGPARSAETPLIAVVDSGIEATHPEFAPDQLVAWKDFVDGRAEPYDDQGHGTAVSSRAAGLTLGAYPGARLAVAKVFSAGGGASATNVNAAIRWAADQGATTINVSLGSEVPIPTDSRGIAIAIHYAREKGALVTWAAGNGGDDLVAGASLPSSTTIGSSSPEALVVGAAGPDGKRRAYSQWDPELLAVSNVLVARRGGAYGVGGGTSYSAPWMAGAVARLVAEGAPRDLDWLKWVVLHSAVDDPDVAYIDEGYGFFGAASLDAALAVARGDAPIPDRDQRDDQHDVATAVRAAQTQQPMTETTKPAS